MAFHMPSGICIYSLHSWKAVDTRAVHCEFLPHALIGHRWRHGSAKCSEVVGVTGYVPSRMRRSGSVAFNAIVWKLREEAPLRRDRERTILETECAEIEEEHGKELLSLFSKKESGDTLEEKNRVQIFGS